MMRSKTMKMMTALLLLLAVGVVPIMSRAEEPKAVTAPEQKATEPKPEDKVTGEIAASILSAYIWRGQELSRHSAVIQPSVTASYKGFTANVWGNLDTRPYGAAGEKFASNYTETDLTLSYSRKFGIVQVGGGYIYYALAALTPGSPDPLDSQELFVSVGLDTILAPTLTIYKEIDHYHQWYALLALSHTFALHDKVSLKLSGSVSYLKSTDEGTYAKYDSNALATTDKFNNFHDGTLSISLPVAVTKSLTVTPIASYVFPLTDDARYEMKARGLQGAAAPSDRDSSYLYGGVTLSFTF